MITTQAKERPLLVSRPLIPSILRDEKTQTRRIVKPSRGYQSTWLSGEALRRSPRAKPVSIKDEMWAQFAHPHAGTVYQGLQIEEWSPLTCVRCPYGKPGDRLWVRETWGTDNSEQDNCPPSMLLNFESVGLLYRADSPDCFAKWRPSIHMPRWASRILLEIVDIRVERLQDITEEDAIAEGVRFTDFGTYIPDGTMSVDGGATFHPFKPRQHAGYHIKPVNGPDECHKNPRMVFSCLWDSINAKGGHSWDANDWVWVIEFRRVEA